MPQPDTSEAQARASLSRQALPVRLERPPLQEAVFEIRFAPRGPSVVSLLPGLVFAELGSEYSRSETLPLASVPPQIRNAQPNFKYQQQIRLSGQSASIFVGDCVAGVSLQAPYPGWDLFLPRIVALLKVLRRSNLVGRVERISLKSVNLLPVQNSSDQLNTLDLKVEIGGRPAPDTGFSLRTELNDARFVRIVEIVTNAELSGPGMPARPGLLLSLDCIHMLPNDQGFWDSAESLISAVHTELRTLFFALLSRETLGALGPLYA